MPNDRRYLIHLPHFSEYLFRLLTTLPEDKKSVLTEYERLQISTPMKVQKFVANEPFEKLLFIYTKLGYEWGITLGPTDEHTQRAVESCRNQYNHETHRSDATEVIVREQVCALTSREVMMLIQMCAQNCNTRAYQITYLMQSVMQVAGKLGKKPYDLTVKEAQGAIDVINDLMLAQLSTTKYTESVLGFKPTQLKVLLSLFSKRNAASTLKEITKDVNLDNKYLSLGVELKKMEKSGYIIADKSGNGRKVHYMITTKGIESVMGYQRYVWGKVFGE